MDGYEATMAAARADRIWLRPIKACLDYTVEQRRKGQTDNFTRSTIHFRLGERDGQGPLLTPLVKWGVIERAWVNAKGTPYYRIADPNGVERALGELGA
jgi:hypothetical protein